MAPRLGFVRQGAALRWTPERVTGPAVVLLHGFLDAAGSWDLVAPLLAAAGHPVVALDLRGHGEGHRADPRDYYHFPDYLLDVDELVHAHADLATPFVLVGHSMGGMVSTMFAGTYPERVSHLVNIEGLGPPENDLETTPARMRDFVDAVRAVRTRGPAPPMTRAEGLRRLERSHPTVPPDVLASRFVHLTNETPDGRFVWKHDPLHRTRGPFPFRVSAYARFAANVTAPVLYVSGGANGFRVTGEETRLASFRTLSRLDLEGAGHMAHWTRPTELASAILTHVES